MGSNGNNIVYANDKFIPAAEATVSIFDRGFLYGDGLFETLRVYQGRPFRWQEHILRFQRSAELLRMPWSMSAHDLQVITRELIVVNQMPEAILRVTLSRGPGPRGYSPKDCRTPTFVMGLHPPPKLGAETIPWRLITARSVAAATGLMGEVKSCSRLAQVMARAEAEAMEADEALLLNSRGKVAEGAASNLFWIDRKVVHTPSAADGALAGITRGVVLELCHQLSISFREKSAAPEQLQAVEGIFLSLSSMGIVEAQSLDGSRLGQSPLTAQLQQAYEKLVQTESTHDAW